MKLTSKRILKQYLSTYSIIELFDKKRALVWLLTHHIGLDATTADRIREEINTINQILIEVDEL